MIKQARKLQATLVRNYDPLHYAAKESNRELNKSLEVIALLLLIFGPNLIILCFPGVKP